MSGTFQQIRALQDDQRAVMLESMDKAQAAFGPLLEYIVETAGTALRVHESAVRDSSVVRSVASERSEEKADSSPLTNRGVTPSDENTPKPRRAKASWVVSGKKVSKKNGV